MAAQNTLPFQYLIRGETIARMGGAMHAQAVEQRDVELEDYLGRLFDYVRSLEARIAALEP